MKYENARDIFPPELLAQIQRYVSGKAIYIPSPEPKKWGESSGYRRYLRDRNRDIRRDFAAGQPINVLAERYCLSVESIRRIVYSKKEEFVMDYACTLTNALECAAHGMIEDWVHAYLLSDGANKPFSDGLRLFERTWHGPVSFPLSQLSRNTGPEEGMRWRIPPEWFEQHVSDLMEAIRAQADLPPLIVHYWIPEGKTEGEFELNDGNHRLEAFKRLGIGRYHVIFWCTEKHEYEQLMTRYGQMME